jgi:hypothetical protein
MTVIGQQSDRMVPTAEAWQIASDAMVHGEL